MRRVQVLTSQPSEGRFQYSLRRYSWVIHLLPYRRRSFIGRYGRFLPPQFFFHRAIAYSLKISAHFSRTYLPATTVPPLSLRAALGWSREGQTYSSSRDIPLGMLHSFPDNQRGYYSPIASIHQHPCSSVCAVLTIRALLASEDGLPGTICDRWRDEYRNTSGLLVIIFDFG